MPEPGTFAAELVRTRRNILDPAHPVNVVFDDSPVDPSADAAASSLVVYPAGAYFPAVPGALTGAFARAHLLPADQAEPGAEAEGLARRPVGAGHVLVCAHMARDARCGVLGPLVAAEFARVLAERGLHAASDAEQGEGSSETPDSPLKYTVSLCTHVGGHVVSISLFFWGVGVFFFFAN